jgi:hypothetical protein
MKAQLLLLVGGVAGGLGLGWLTAPLPDVEARAAFETPNIVFAGAEAGQAYDRLNALGLAPAPLIETGPPPPDVAVLFRRDLTAIEEVGGRRVVWIVDLSQSHQRRALRVGDSYRDAWRVARINHQSVELRRRREVRIVDAFALPVSQP